MLSARNLNEITKINWNTGDIIWRLSGTNNMFEFINDTLQFSWQHDCRRLDNGNLSVFDNGTYHPDPISSVVEYELDEINFTATLINRYRNDPDAFGTIMGNGQETENGNMVAGWGSSGEPAITEFGSNGDILAEISIESINYRAYRYPWETNYFSLDSDTLQYGYIWQENTLTKSLSVYNNSDSELNLTSYYSMNDAFMVENEFPVTIPKGGSTNVQVTFDPGEVGMFEGILTINSDINSDTLVQRIAQQVYLIGNATEGQGYKDLTYDTKVMIYPNPVDEILILEFPDDNFKGTLKLYDIHGKCVIKTIVASSQKIELNTESLTPGVYFVYLNKFNSTGNHCYKIIKN